MKFKESSQSCITNIVITYTKIYKLTFKKHSRISYKNTKFVVKSHSETVVRMKTISPQSWIIKILSRKKLNSESKLI